MRVEQRIVACEPSDPDRCQAVGSGGEGQCRYLSIKGMKKAGLLEDIDQRDVENATNCYKHGAKIVLASQKKRLHDYRLQIWQERLDEFTESEHVKTLRGEIGVLRLTLETVLQQCRTPADLIMYSTKIADLSIKIERLVRTCNAAEAQMGMMMDRATAQMFASDVIQIISRHVKSPEAIDDISKGIIQALITATEPKLVLT